MWPRELGLRGQRASGGTPLPPRVQSQAGSEVGRGGRGDRDRLQESEPPPDQNPAGRPSVQVASPPQDPRPHAPGTLTGEGGLGLASPPHPDLSVAASPWATGVGDAMADLMSEGSGGCLLQVTRVLRCPGGRCGKGKLQHNVLTGAALLIRPGAAGSLGSVAHTHAHVCAHTRHARAPTPRTRLRWPRWTPAGEGAGPRTPSLHAGLGGGKFYVFSIFVFRSRLPTSEHRGE